VVDKKSYGNTEEGEGFICASGKEDSRHIHVQIRPLAIYFWRTLKGCRSNEFVAGRSKAPKAIPCHMKGVTVFLELPCRRRKHSS
jgi:hypothetical protein